MIQVDRLQKENEELKKSNCTNKCGSDSCFGCRKERALLKIAVGLLNEATSGAGVSHLEWISRKAALTLEVQKLK